MSVNVRKAQGAGIRSIEQITTAPLTRRSFMKIGVNATAAAAALGWALSPLRESAAARSAWMSFCKTIMSASPLMR